MRSIRVATTLPRLLATPAVPSRCLVSASVLQRRNASDNMPGKSLSSTVSGHVEHAKAAMLPAFAALNNYIAEVGPCKFAAGLLAASIPTYYTFRYIRELFTLSDLQNRAVFITGCDTGFGHLLALKCAKNGLPVFAAVLTDEGAANLQRASRGFKGTLHTIKVDVRNDESFAQAVKFVESKLHHHQKLWAIVNNAGIAIFEGPDDWTSIETHKLVFDINTLGLVRGVKAFLPMLKESQGRILNCTSVLGRFGIQGLSSYVVSKFAGEGYTDVLRRELRHFGITCHLFEPGFFKTAVIPTDKLKAQVDKAWARLPAHVKDQYGEDYYRKYVEYYIGASNNASLNVSWVVDQYYHGITAKYPRNRYQSGYDCLFKFIPFTFCPTWFQDFAYRQLLPDHVPAVARRG